MTQPELESLLGRSLTSIESTNLEKYLDIAEQRLENLLCIRFGEGTETRTYIAREGYKNVFTDPMTEVTTIEVDGEEKDYTLKQWDDFNGDWKNQIVFDETLESGLVTVTAKFGYGNLPSDLKLLKARLFGNISTEQVSDSRVTQKRNEDYQVHYDTKSAWSALVSDNNSTIQKYSQCGLSVIAHGDPETPIHRTGEIV